MSMDGGDRNLVEQWHEFFSRGTRGFATDADSIANEAGRLTKRVFPEVAQVVKRVPPFNDTTSITETDAGKVYEQLDTMICSCVNAQATLLKLHSRLVSAASLGLKMRHHVEKSCSVNAKTSGKSARDFSNVLAFLSGQNGKVMTEIDVEQKPCEDEVLFGAKFLSTLSEGILDAIPPEHIKDNKVDVHVVIENVSASIVSRKIRHFFNTTGIRLAPFAERMDMSKALLNDLVSRHQTWPRATPQGFILYKSVIQFLIHPTNLRSLYKAAAPSWKYLHPDPLALPEDDGDMDTSDRFLNSSQKSATKSEVVATPPLCESLAIPRDKIYGDGGCHFTYLYGERVPLYPDPRTGGFMVDADVAKKAGNCDVSMDKLPLESFNGSEENRHPANDSAVGEISKVNNILDDLRTSRNDVEEGTNQKLQIILQAAREQTKQATGNNRKRKLVDDGVNGDESPSTTPTPDIAIDLSLKPSGSSNGFTFEHETPSPVDLSTTGPSNNEQKVLHEEKNRMTTVTTSSSKVASQDTQSLNMDGVTPSYSKVVSQDHTQSIMSILAKYSTPLRFPLIEFLHKWSSFGQSTWNELMSYLTGAADVPDTISIAKLTECLLRDLKKQPEMRHLSVATGFARHVIGVPPKTLKKIVLSPIRYEELQKTGNTQFQFAYIAMALWCALPDGGKRNSLLYFATTSNQPNETKSTVPATSPPVTNSNGQTAASQSSVHSGGVSESVANVSNTSSGFPMDGDQTNSGSPSSDGNGSNGELSSSLTLQQLDVLTRHYDSCAQPTIDQFSIITDKTKLSLREVQQWFKRRRQRDKQRQQIQQKLPLMA